MNLIELKKAVDAAFERAAECLVSPEDIDVSLQIDTCGESDVKCSKDIDVYYDNNVCASGFVLVGTVGYEA